LLLCCCCCCCCFCFCCLDVLGLKFSRIVLWPQRMRLPACHLAPHAVKVWQLTTLCCWGSSWICRPLGANLIKGKKLLYLLNAWQSWQAKQLMNLDIHCKLCHIYLNNVTSIWTLNNFAQKDHTSALGKSDLFNVSFSNGSTSTI
jgi:hypothetical protein